MVVVDVRAQCHWSCTCSTTMRTQRTKKCMEVAEMTTKTQKRYLTTTQRTTTLRAIMNSNTMTLQVTLALRSKLTVLTGERTAAIPMHCQQMRHCVALLTKALPTITALVLPDPMMHRRNVHTLLAFG